MSAMGSRTEPDLPSRTVIAFDNVSIVFGDAPAQALPLMDEGLSREEVQTRAGQVLGVHNCSLSVRKGEISVLMGLSGSGKSTLLRAVNGLNPVTRGRMLVRDKTGDLVDVATCAKGTLRALRRSSVSMVFQQFALLPWRSVIENVALGLELAGVSRDERLDKARRVLDTVNLGHWAGRRVSDLSGGMQQRVGLARAFATDAEILLMDEPFSALDPLIRAHLQDELLELQERLGCTILFVSHDLEEAVKLGNTITIMEGGRIIQTGRPEEIVLQPATGYVSEFVAHLNPLSVLRASDVMELALPRGEAPQVPAHLPLRDVLPLLADGAGEVGVELDGKLAGRVTQRAALQALSSGS
jgi:glycine betaine/proline transport system ATP-binding protein